MSGAAIPTAKPMLTAADVSAICLHAIVFLGRAGARPMITLLGACGAVCITVITMMMRTNGVSPSRYVTTILRISVGRLSLIHI